MKIVLDINALLIAIPRKSSYRLIFDSIISGDIQLIVSNDILSEYIEVITAKANSIVAKTLLSCF